MIRRFNSKNKQQLAELVYFVKNNFDADFYLTKDNQRQYVFDEPSLKIMLKEATEVYVADEEVDYGGLILLWKAVAGEITRYYIKIIAKNEHVAKALLTILLWNNFQELYVKLNKHHPFLHVFKRMGFAFKGGRGRQLLLYKQKQKPKLFKRKEK